MATKHLIEQGCRKIGHICGSVYNRASRDRSLGFEEVMKDQGGFAPSLIVPSEFHIEGGYRAMKELLARHPDVDGVFAGNDLMAVGAIKALFESGRRVPDDVKLIGFDGIALNAVIPELSTIVQPIFQIGTMAMNSLYKLINGEDIAEQTYELDVELAVKQSSTKGYDQFYTRSSD